MRYGAGHEDDLPPGGMLASESDRLAAQDVLKQAYEDKRLTLDEFESRVGRAMAARYQGELARLTRDIPAAPAPTPAPAPAVPPPARRRRSLRWPLIAVACAVPVTVGLVLAFSSTPQTASSPRPVPSGPAGCPAGTPSAPLAIANALARDPVYVDQGSSSVVTPAQAQRLRAEIGSADSGRIRLVVLTPAAVKGGGGEKALADAIAGCQADSEGVTMVTTVDSTFLAVSYNDHNQTVQAVKTAFDTTPTTAAALEDAVKRIAALDPGKS